jgi:hypothetical protein
VSGGTTGSGESPPSRGPRVAKVRRQQEEKPTCRQHLVSTPHTTITRPLANTTVTRPLANTTVTRPLANSCVAGTVLNQSWGWGPLCSGCQEPGDLTQPFRGVDFSPAE